MAFKIAIAGKGGTGKTTLSALLCRCLLNRSIKPVLAVDADPNSCLPDRLGVTLPHEHLFANGTRMIPRDGFSTIWAERADDIARTISGEVGMPLKLSAMISCPSIPLPKTCRRAGISSIIKRWPLSYYLSRGWPVWQCFSTCGSRGRA